jgi:CDP-2,3-bis-(O-geranylgeranyl)-sn-glycerol synthase
VLAPLVASAAAVLWILLPAYVASALAPFSRGRGPPMDFGRTWRRDGRRVLGPSKSWSGFFLGSLLAVPVGLLEAGLILAAPPNLALVPRLAPTVVAAIPVVALVSFGGMAGDALGSFVKRRLNVASGERAVLLDQLPFVLLPVGLGLLLDRPLFGPVFLAWEGVLWLLVFTVVLHTAFNWIGHRAGLKEVPW